MQKRELYVEKRITPSYCTTFLRVSSECHSVLGKHFILNGKYNPDKKRAFFLFDKIILLFLNTFNFSVIYTCGDTLQRL